MSGTTCSLLGLLNLFSQRLPTDALASCHLDAPLERTPVLVRGGGILVLGGKCTKNIYDGTNERTVLVFPAPSSSSSSSASGQKGSFTLIEDDGKSNDHTNPSRRGYTEIFLSFTVVEGGESVEVDFEVVHRRFELPYEVVWFELPRGDRRTLKVREGKVEAGRKERRVGVMI